jgi:Rieske Fe-S protein
MSDGISRRVFLQTTATAAACVGCGALAAACGGSDETNPATALTVDANGKVLLPFTDARFSALQTVGSEARVSVMASTGLRQLAVVRAATTTVHAVTVVCTHQGCTIGNYQPQTMLFECACHGSRFAADGTVIRGPAPTNLQQFTAVVEATGIRVTVG